jgi:hypothetical protein
MQQKTYRLIMKHQHLHRLLGRGDHAGCRWKPREMRSK